MKTECDAVFAAAMEGRLEEPEASHAATCPTCQAVLGPARAPSPSMASELRAEVQAELTRRPRATPWAHLAARIAAAQLAGVLAMVAVFGVENGRTHLGSRAGFAVAAVGLLLLVAASAVAAVVPRGRRARWLLAGLALLAPLAVLWSGDGQPLGLPAEKAVRCAWTEAAVSVFPLAVALWALSGRAFGTVRAWTASAGAASGGLLVLHLHCQDGSAPHLLTYHLLPWALLGLGAVLVRSRLPTRCFAP